MHKNLAEQFGAALIAATLIATGWLAFRNGPPARAPGESAPTWDVDAELRSEVLSRLPPVFEAQTRKLVGEDFIPPLSAFDVQVQGKTRRGDLRLVILSAECNPERPESAPSAPDGFVPAPAPGLPRTCFFRAAYDVDAHRFVQMTFDEPRPWPQPARLDCTHDRFQAVTHMAGLPRDMLVALQADTDMADTDGILQATDVGVPGGLKRRFALAEIGTDRAIVAIEQGGMFHHDEAWVFERRAGHWDGDPRWLINGRPNSAQALLSAACEGVPFPPTHGLGTADRIYGQDQDDGSLLLGVIDDHGAGYSLRLGAAGEIVDPSWPNGIFTAQGRRDLRQRLLTLRADVLPDQPAYAYLSRYLAAIDRDAPPARVSH